MAKHPTACKHVFTRLRQGRSNAGLTQTQVAKKLQRSQNYVSKCESWERRVNVLDTRTAQRLNTPQLPTKGGGPGALRR